MEIVRTPDDRFVNLPGWPFAPRYTDVDAADGSGARIRIHHIDEGPKDAAETILLVHGEPSWGYLYRHMVPVFVAAGHRVIVPDLPGFGRSDSPADHAIPTRIAHARAFIDHIGPGRYSVWGSSMGTYLGCAIALEDPRLAKLVIMPSTILPPPLPEGAVSAVPQRESVAEIVRKHPPSIETAIEMSAAL
mgnify:CR=1 FL=1